MASLEAGAEHPIFLISRDDRGRVTGGLQGVILHRWLKIQLMAIDPEHRHRGIGRSLVLEAEKIARQRECDYAYVDTMSYQAPEFYARLGFKESGRLSNWDSHGHDKIFFTKCL